jgi:cob(I)alamin adenosyltransferase
MGNRLTSIYTRTGDDGTTGLGTGDRVAKECARVEAYGTVDELNCCLGLVLASRDLPDPVLSCLQDIQQRLFDLGGELAVPGRDVLTSSDVSGLESALDDFNAALPPLKDFILPGGSESAARCHLARAVCRRAERRTWTLSRDEPVNAESLRYLNRLSDLLFVIARVLARAGGGAEILWQARKPG